MANEHVDRPRTGPVRVVRMSIMAADPRASVDDPLVIVAELDPGDEQLWWMGQLRERVKVLGGSGSPAAMTSVRVEAPPDQVQEVARRLLTAVEEANAAYPERHAAWRREHDDRMAEERLRWQHRFAAQQAILDHVMDQYRPNQSITWPLPCRVSSVPGPCASSQAATRTVLSRSDRGDPRSTTSSGTQRARPAPSDPQPCEQPG